MTKWMFTAIFAILLQGYNGEKTADEILNNLVSYDHRVPPHGAKGPGSPVEVKITMFIIGLELDDIKQEMSADIYLRQMWRDPRLTYKSEAGKEKHLSYQDLSRIWIPDLFFLNKTQGKFNTILVPNAMIKWELDGTIFMTTRLSMTFRCEMDMTYYPHDEHTCTFSIRSYALTRKEIEIMWPYMDDDGCGVNINPFVSLDNFQFIGHTCFTHYQRMATGRYSQIGVNIRFKRNSGLYVRKLYIPYILLTIVSWLSLWINPRFHGLRLSLLFSVMFIMLLIAFDMDRYIPPVPYTKSIDIWTIFCISLVFSLFLEFIFLALKCETKGARNSSQTGADAKPLEKHEKDSKYHRLKFQIFREKFNGGRFIFYNKADFASRFIFPALFGIFNVLYWHMYVS